MTISITHSENPVLVPDKGSPWAETMVLNPAIIMDSESARIHMLFRASGPWPQNQLEGKPMPYPIFLGYAFSDDNGETWEADFSRPALEPALKSQPDDLYITNVQGERVVNYGNGLVEDPRLFMVENKLYLSVAGRLFPPGPFWACEEIGPYIPDWGKSGEHTFGRAVTENLAVSALYEVDLAQLSQRNYEEAFKYVTNLTDPELGDNRDVFLFPEKFMIDGRSQYVCLHRPVEPWHFSEGESSRKPTMYMAAADSIFDFGRSNCTHKKLAEIMFDWEEERIGGSWSPFRISETEWLLPYHGKKDNKVGYTQSFMILRDVENSFPEVIHRCSERLMYAEMDWELPGNVEDNALPVIFTCGGVVIDDELIMSYGASDELTGIGRVNLSKLIDHVRTFNAQGGKI